MSRVGSGSSFGGMIMGTGQNTVFGGGQWMGGVRRGQPRGGMSSFGGSSMFSKTPWGSWSTDSNNGYQGGIGGFGGAGRGSGRGGNNNNFNKFNNTQANAFGEPVSAEMGATPGKGKKRPFKSIKPSTWITTYDRKLPAALLGLCKEDQCDLCKVIFNSPYTAKSHYDGKNHEKQVNSYLTEHCPEGDSRPKKLKLSSPITTDAATDAKNLYCAVCNLSCTSQVEYDSHMVGKNHTNKVQLKNMAADGSRQDMLECSVCNIWVSCTLAMNNHLAGKKHRKKSEKVGEKKSEKVGEKKSEKVEEKKSEKVGESQQDLTCEVCGVSATDKQGLESHFSYHLDFIQECL